MNSALKRRFSSVFDKFTAATAVLERVVTSWPLMLVAVFVNFFLYQKTQYSAIIILNVIVISVYLLCFRGVLCCLFPFLLACFGSINYYSLTADGIKALIPWAIIPAVALLLHLVIYPVKREDVKTGKQFWSLVAISVAVIFAGVDKIDSAAYFTLKNIYYVLALGFGSVAAYTFVLNYLPSDKDKAKTQLCNAVTLAGLMGVLQMLALVYMVVSGKQPLQILGMQGYRNNFAALMLMLAPLSFYSSFIGKRRFMGYLLGVLVAASACVTFSRAGFVTAVVEVVLCGLFCILFSDYRTRGFYIGMFVATVLGFVLLVSLAEGFFDILSGRFDVASSDVRSEIWKYGFGIFKDNVVFGAGWMFEGNQSYVHTGPFSIYWFHNSFVQIVASAGVLGILCYGFGYVQKIYYLCTKPFSAHKAILTITFVGFMMMNMLHPIEFTPVPYLTLLYVFFAASEHFDGAGGKIDELKLLEKSEISKFYKAK